MKKITILTLCLFIGNVAFSQKVMTRSGEIKFDASVPYMEEVAAINNTASCIIDQATGDFVALALIKAFTFKIPLMQEHFNENYMESSKFPKSTFKGKIVNFDASKLSATKTMYDLEGDLTIHGVTKKIKTKISLSSTAGKVNSTCQFTVKAEDYEIEIPNIVKKKFGENIEVALNFTLEEK